MARRTLLITYIASYLLTAGMIIRILISFRDDRIWSIALLVGGYLVLLIAEPLFIHRNRPLTYIYLIIQIAIIGWLAILTPSVDFWAVLFVPLIVQVMHNFERRNGFLITGFFTGITSILMLSGLGLEVGLPLILVYGVIYYLMAGFIAIIREAIAARDDSQRQQIELQAAHQQLQSYTAQAEELAVLEERNRLARDLHDSVTQSIYSLTLMAEAGQRMIKRGELQQAEVNQARLAEIAQQALQEMRLLVYQLRPQVLYSKGLIGAIEHRLEAVERRAGIEARLRVEVELDLPVALEEELFHISMEALNNALKHSKASEVELSLHGDGGSLIMEVEDNGQGFDQELARKKSGMGLTSMGERADNMGGKLTIQSEPGLGTTVRVVVPFMPPMDIGVNSQVSTDQQEVSL